MTETKLCNSQNYNSTQDAIIKNIYVANDSGKFHDAKTTAGLKYSLITGD